MNLREMIDVRHGLSVPIQKPEYKFKVGDQAVIYRPVGFSSKTKEVVVGKILASAGEGKFVVAIPRPGGVSLRSTVNANQLKPVTDVFRRNSVQINPAFRG